MARNIIFTKDKLGRLRPSDALSAELWDDLPADKEMRAVVTQPRNLQHHRKFFTLLSVIFPHQDLYTSIDGDGGLLDGIKPALGHTHEVRNAETLEAHIRPASISFGSMDQDAFEEFYDRSVDLICRRIIPGLGHADLEREVNEILAGNR